MALKYKYVWLKGIEEIPWLWWQENWIELSNMIPKLEAAASQMSHLQPVSTYLRWLIFKQQKSELHTNTQMPIEFPNPRSNNICKHPYYNQTV